MCILQECDWASACTNHILSHPYMYDQVIVTRLACPEYLTASQSAPNGSYGSYGHITCMGNAWGAKFKPRARKISRICSPGANWRYASKGWKRDLHAHKWPEEGTEFSYEAAPMHGIQYSEPITGKYYTEQKLWHGNIENTVSLRPTNICFFDLGVTRLACPQWQERVRECERLDRAYSFQLSRVAY